MFFLKLEKEKCFPLCQNGGICKQDGTCDCTTTGFSGPSCIQPCKVLIKWIINVSVVCEPTCKNNGVCVLKTDGSMNTTCDCPIGFQGTVDCSLGPTSSNASTIAAISISVILFVLIAIIVGFLLWRRQSKKVNHNI